MRKRFRFLHASRLVWSLALLQSIVFIIGYGTARAYSYTGYKWSNASANYYVASGWSTNARDAIRAADATWDAAGSVFRFSYVSTTTRSPSQIVNLSCDLYNDVGYSNLGNIGAVARTVGSQTSGKVKEVDTAFNSYYYHTAAGAVGAYDIQNTMTHEFGHWLVLADVNSSGSPSNCGTSSEATMCGLAGPGETRKRSLAVDDKNAAIGIYGK